MGGCERCESPPNNKKLRDDESTMVDSQSCMSWCVFLGASQPVRLGPSCRARVGKVGPGALATARNGCAGAGWCWLVVCNGAQAQAGAIPSIDPIDRPRHQPQRPAPPNRAVTLSISQTHVVPSLLDPSAV